MPYERVSISPAHSKETGGFCRNARRVEVEDDGIRATHVRPRQRNTPRKVAQ